MGATTSFATNDLFLAGHSFRIDSVGTDIEVCDVNGDQKLDLIIADPNGLSRVSYNEGDAYFAKAQDGPPGMRSLQVIDIDQDFDPDIVFASDRGFTMYANQAGDQGEALGLFSYLTSFGTYAPAFTVGSFHRDELHTDQPPLAPPELVVGRANQAAEVWQYDGDNYSLGHFEPALSNLTALVAARIDGDGFLDLAAVSRQGTQEKLLICSNRTPRTSVDVPWFQVLETHDVGSVTKVLAGNLDSNLVGSERDVDLIVIGRQGQPRENNPHTLWINQGGIEGGVQGSMAPGGSLPNLGTTTDAELADFDNDGDLDLVTVNNWSDGHHPDNVWINQGGDQGGTRGEFLIRQTLGPAGASFSVGTGDLDGDGAPAHLVGVVRLTPGPDGAVSVSASQTTLQYIATGHTAQDTISYQISGGRYGPRDFPVAHLTIGGHLPVIAFDDHFTIDHFSDSGDSVPATANDFSVNRPLLATSVTNLSGSTNVSVVLVSIRPEGGYLNLEIDHRGKLAPRGYLSEYTVSDGITTDAALISLWPTVDKLCLTEYLPSPFGSRRSDGSTSNIQAERPDLDATEALGVFRQLRDRFMKPTEHGEALASLYYEHTPELVSMVTTHEGVRSNLLNSIAAWYPVIEDLVKGSGSEVITAAHIAALRHGLLSIAIRGSGDRSALPGHV